jgi:adenylate cyclase
MLEIHVFNSEQHETFKLDAGNITLGRRSKTGDAQLVSLTDEFVSRNQLAVDEIQPGRVALRNMSSKVAVQVEMPIHQLLPPDIGARAYEFDLPVKLTVGKTVIEVESPALPGMERPSPRDIDTSSLMTISEPVRLKKGGSTEFNLETLDPAPDAERLISWFETLVSVQHAAAGSGEFYQQTAKAIVEMVGLDYGMVLLLKNDDWTIVAKYPAETAPDDFSRTLVDQVARQGRTLFHGSGADLTTKSLIDMSAWVASPILDARTDSVIGVVYGVRALVLGVKGRPLEGRIGVSTIEAKLLQVLGATVASGLARQKKEAEAIRAHVQFEQFVSPEVVRELERDPDLLKGRDREVTVLFADIRNFSRMSERFGARFVCDLLVSFMDKIGERIREFQGTMVDYLGDGLFAMWNAPVEQPKHAELACRAALAIIEDLPEINRQFAETIGDPLVLGIGINSGMAMVGNNGSRSRFHYGPMGHTVNLASRVEGATKQLGVGILITGSTREQLGDGFATRRICRARLTGMDEPVDLFELQSAAVADEWKIHRDAYEWALGLYENRKWGEACAALVELLADYKSEVDGPTVALVSRTAECLKSQPSSFEPIWSIVGK